MRAFTFREYNLPEMANVHLLAHRYFPVVLHQGLFVGHAQFSFGTVDPDEP